MKSPIKLVGGKYKLAKKIVSFLPDHNLYLEPFAGGAHIFFAKPKVNVEMLCDANDDLINFYKQIKVEGKELAEELRNLPYSRKIWNDWKRMDKYKNDFERALHWFYVMRSSYAGWFGPSSGWAFGSTGNLASSYRSAVELIPQMQTRLKDTYIECLDFRDSLKKVPDNKKSLIYCDPPYIEIEGRKYGYYKENAFTKDDHMDLAKILSSFEFANIVLSYEDHPYVRQMYTSWNITEWNVVRGATCIKGKNRGEIGGKAKKVRSEELLLTNYKRRDLFELLGE